MNKNKVLAAMTLALVSTGAHADYLRDSSGSVAQNSYGECWHSRYQKEANGVVPCEPEKVGMVVALVHVPPAEPVSASETVSAVSLDADTYFEFDKATLKPGATDKLDTLISEIKQAEEFGQVTVTGHTDRIGNDAYNQNLSEARAATVRDYLAGHLELSERIVAVGKGESMATTQCDGKSGNRLIACLAPDRRVEVDVDVRTVN